ncbi:MAG TPA: hypothetical protein VK890_11235 [Bacteroidia bacterium]|jgi:hypothetical protein|nr:hypothetical protein [Bacteroidia bacterium]
MKRALFLIIIIIKTVALFAQEGSNAPRMAFYGVDYDTLAHKRDTIFHVDSAHIAIFGSAGSAFNTAIEQSSFNSLTYIGYRVSPGTAFSFGFDYVSKEHNNNWFFSLGLGIMVFTCTGNYYYSLPGSPKYTDTSAYVLQGLSVDIPFRVYYRFSKTKKFRFSAGLGVSVGAYLTQSNSFGFGIPENLATACMRFDIAAGRHTWFAFEPYYSIQMFEEATHLESVGLKVEIL